MLTVRICVDAVKGGVLKGSERPAAGSKVNKKARRDSCAEDIFPIFFMQSKKKAPLRAKTQTKSFKEACKPDVTQCAHLESSL